MPTSHPQLDTPPEPGADTDALGAVASWTGTAGEDAGADTGTKRGAVSAAKGETTEIGLSRVQQTFARRVAESQATIPQLTLQVEVDLEGCLAGANRGAPGCAAEIVRACALALREHPRVNSAYRDGCVQMRSRVNIGVAVAIDAEVQTGEPGKAGKAASATGESGGGTETITPTVFDADTLTAEEIARQTDKLRMRAHEGTLAPPELSGATFTVIDLGTDGLGAHGGDLGVDGGREKQGTYGGGVDAFTATVQPGQAAILAVGSVRPRPVASDDGRVVAHRTATLTLSCDHRVLYGADAARFLARIRELLEAPRAS